MFDTLIKNGRVVLADREETLDIGIRDGRIAALAPNIDTACAREMVDASGQYVMPGMVDAHMHVSEPGRTEWEGYETGTQAMVAGGITSFVEMPLNTIPATTNVETLELKLRTAEGKCWADYAPMGGGSYRGTSTIWHRLRMLALQPSRPLSPPADPASPGTSRMSPTSNSTKDAAELRKRTGF